jgi:hypothetical protein
VIGPLERIWAAVHGWFDALGRFVAEWARIEFVWTGIAVIGFLFSLWAAGDGWLDLASVRAEIKRGHLLYRGPRWWIAMGNFVSSTGWAFAWLMGFTIGCMVITRILAEYVGWLLVLMFLLLAVVQVWQRYARGKVGVATVLGTA